MHTNEILTVRNLKQHFYIHKHLTIKAVDGISFSIAKGEILGLVGETGSGKSSVARTIVGIHRPTAGEIMFKGHPISCPKVSQLHEQDIQKNMQIIFQDSAAALNPRMTAAQIIAEPLHIHHCTGSAHQLEGKLDVLLAQVGLDPIYKTKYPAQLSGGQRQRIAIARSLATSPDLIIADEPVASLDVSIQAQIINLFKKLQCHHGFSFLLIAHDLAIIKFICTKVAVMFNGKIVELAPTRALFSNPLHPYTQSLLAALPIPDPIGQRSKQRHRCSYKGLPLNGRMTEVAPGHYLLTE